MTVEGMKRLLDKFVDTHNMEDEAITRLYKHFKDMTNTNTLETDKTRYNEW